MTQAFRSFEAGAKGLDDHLAFMESIPRRVRVLFAGEVIADSTSVEIMQIIAELNHEQGITVVLVTHEPEIGIYADRVLTFRDGEIVADAPREQFEPSSSAPGVAPEITKGLA